MQFNIRQIEIENFRSVQSKVTLAIKPGLYSIEGINNDEIGSYNGCFTGDTKVITADGIKEIKNIVKTDKVNTQYISKTSFTRTSGSFISKYVKELIELTLDSGKIIRCTPEHKFVIYNPRLDDKDLIWENNIAYKEAQNLTNNDELEQIFYGYIYKITNLINNKVYIGSKKSKVFVDSYWSSSQNKDFWDDLEKYGKENFKREILEWVICNNNRELVDVEKIYVKEYFATHSIDEIYNRIIPTSQVIWTKEMLDKRSAKVRGRPCKEETKEKIRKALLERNKRLRKKRVEKNKTGWKAPKDSSLTLSEKLKGHPSWNHWKENGFGTPEFSKNAGKSAWEKHPEELKVIAIKNIVKYNKSKKGRKTSRKNAEHMRNLKVNKTDEEKLLICLKQSLGGLKRHYGKLSKQYLDRVEEIRKFEPDYDPEETPKERFKRKHANS